MLERIGMKSSRPFLIGTLAVAAIALGAASGCGSALDMHAATSPNAQFERYRTFAFDPEVSAPDQYATSPRSTEARARIEQIATTILEKRGYSLAAGPADFVVRIEAGRRQPSAVTGAALPPKEQADIPYYGFLDDERQDLVEGSFVIDAFDGQRHQLLWHGSVRAAIDPNRIDGERLRSAVERVMASLPARMGQ